jgi:hypothetical protein
VETKPGSHLGFRNSLKPLPRGRKRLFNLPSGEQLSTATAYRRF